MGPGRERAGMEGAGERRGRGGEVRSKGREKREGQGKSTGPPGREGERREGVGEGRGRGGKERSREEREKGPSCLLCFPSLATALTLGRVYQFKLRARRFESGKTEKACLPNTGVKPSIVSI
jgi:hypothetical protein